MIRKIEFEIQTDETGAFCTDGCYAEYQRHGKVRCKIFDKMLLHNPEGRLVRPLECIDAERK